jgi:putative transcriptional regulator
MRVVLATAALFLALIPGRAGTTAQDAPNGKAQGQFLVASRDLPDPLFRDSVVLMLPIKEGPLLVGLIINKPSKFLLRDAFPDSPALQKLDAKAYVGGPVDLDVGARSAIFRSKTPPKGAVLVFEDVYVSFDSQAIAALAADSEQAATLRVFLGRSQWDPGQFEDEVARGSWHNVPAAADSIFGAFPESLWRTLIDRVDPLPVVRLAPPSPSIGEM